MTAVRIDRRRFLKQAGVLTAAGATLPQFLVDARTALAASRIAGLPDDRVLVLVQLAGGNDGLNTLVPYSDDVYHRARPKLAVDAAEVLRIDDYLGFHPEMTALRSLWEEGRIAAVQNVGYPNPDLSHFRSTAIWETASPAAENWSSGWVGRYFDNECAGVASPLLGVQLGDRTAQTFAGERPRAVVMSNPDLFSFSGGGNRMAELAAAHATGAPTPSDSRPGEGKSRALNFVLRTGNDVLAVTRQLQEAVRSQRTTVEYLPFHFSQSLKLVAQMIAAEVPTRVFYVSLGGFDHHATQAMRHAALLQELSDGLSAFVRDLAGLGHLDRTLVMTFSEFGRRVAENQSGGTDHGTANVMFLAGGSVRAGLHGSRPDLSRLDPVGDLVHTTDFREIYATVLSRWLQADAQTVLKGNVAPFEGLLR